MRPVAVTLTLPNGREIVRATDARGSFRFDNLNLNTRYELRFEDATIYTHNESVDVETTSVTGLEVRLTPRPGYAEVTIRDYLIHERAGRSFEGERHMTAAIGSEIRGADYPGWSFMPASLTVSPIGSNVIRWTVDTRYPL